MVVKGLKQPMRFLYLILLPEFASEMKSTSQFCLRVLSMLCSLNITPQVSVIDFICP